MERIDSLRDLRNGDKVYLYGAPFCADVKKYNPFTVKQTIDTTHHVIFEAIKPGGLSIRQYCSRIYDDTYMFRGELEPRDRLVLYLQGIKEALDWAD